MTGLETYTLRYYEKEGIITPPRSESGIRFYTETDLEKLGMVCCLKTTGMSIRDIKAYFDLAEQGDSTLEERLDIFEKHRQNVINQIGDLQKNLEKVDWKIGFYREKLSERDKANA